MEQEKSPKLAQEIARWLNETPNGKQLLLDHGVQPGHVEKMKRGECYERILFMNARALEEETGFDLHQLMFLDAKQQLWGENDQLSDVQTHQQVMQKLANLIEKYGKKVIAAYIGVREVRRLTHWIETKGLVKFERMRKILELVVQDKNGEVLSTKTTAVSQKQHRIDNDAVRQVVGSSLSIFNSQLKILSTVVQDSALLCDGDRMHVVRVITQLLNIFAVDTPTLQRLNRHEEITPEDTGVLEVIGNLATSTKRPSKQRRSQ